MVYSHDCDDDFEELFSFFLKDDANEFIYGMSEYVMHIDKYCNRAEYR